MTPGEELAGETCDCGKPATCVQEDLYGLRGCDECCDHKPLALGPEGYGLDMVAQCTPIAEVET